MIEKGGTAPETNSDKLLHEAEEQKNGFMEAMSDDFNTALALSHMFDLAKKINILNQALLDAQGVGDAAALQKVLAIYDDMAYILGILQDNVHIDNAADNKLIDQLMDIIISLRQTARQNKHWAIADQIRDQLKAAGIVIEDSPTGAKWKKDEF